MNSALIRRPLIGTESAFTLAEVLAALAFLAIVIPVAVEGLRVANRAGQVGLRKAAATRIADSVLNESMVTQQQVSGLSRGVVDEGAQEYRWTLRSDLWPVDAMRLVTVEVTYSIQGEDFFVRLGTLTSLATP